MFGRPPLPTPQRVVWRLMGVSPLNERQNAGSFFFYVDVAIRCRVCEIKTRHLICLRFLIDTRYAFFNASDRTCVLMLDSYTEADTVYEWFDLFREGECIVRAEDRPSVRCSAQQ